MADKHHRDEPLEERREPRRGVSPLRPGRRAPPARPEDPDERAWRGHDSDDDGDEGSYRELEPPPQSA